MMDITTKVTLLKQYIDRNGNVYPASLVYLLGQLPEVIRDNSEYIKSLETVQFKLEPYKLVEVEDITPTSTNRPEKVKKQVVKQVDLVVTDEITAKRSDG